MYFLFILTISCIKNPKDDASEQVTYPEDTSFYDGYCLFFSKMSFIWITQSTADCESKKEQLNEDSDISFEFSELFCSDGQNIQNEISQIDEYSDNLAICVNIDDVEIDLTQLKNKMPLFLTGEDCSEFISDYSRLLSLKSKGIKNNKSFNPKTLEENRPNRPNMHVKFVGNVGDKVSSILLNQINLEIITSPLNIESLTFDKFEINANSLSIETDFLIPRDADSYINIISNENILNKIKAKQFCLHSVYISSNQIEKPCYRITYEQNGWKVMVKSHGEGNEYESILQTETDFLIPYSICDRLSFTAVSHFFDFHIEDASITSIKPLNITIFDIDDGCFGYEENINFAHILEEVSKYKVYFSTSGNWDQITEKTSIYYNAYLSLTDLDTAYCLDTKVDVSKFSCYYETMRDAAEKNPPDVAYRPTSSNQLVSSMIMIIDDLSTCQTRKELFDNCKNDPSSSTECSELNKYSEFICSDGQNLNELLSQIDDKNNALYISFCKEDVLLDLNQLKNKKKVFLSSGSISENTENQAKKLNQKSLIIPRFPTIDVEKTRYNVKIQGNIKEKVDFLYIEYINIQIVESPLNIENLDVQGVFFINSDSLNLEPTHMLVDYLSHEHFRLNGLNEEIKEKIKAKQYGLKFNSELPYVASFRIKFRQNEWRIYGKQLNDGYLPIITVPYSFCERLSLAYACHFYDIRVESNKVTTIKPVNITVIGENSDLSTTNLNSETLLENEKYSVKITTSGYWNQITDDVSVYFSSYEDYVSLDKEKVNSKVNIQTYDLLTSSFTDNDQDQDQTSSSIEEENPSDSTTSSEENPSDSATSSEENPSDSSPSDEDKSNEINIIDGNVEYSKDNNDYLDQIKQKFSGENVNDQAYNLLSLTLPQGENTYDFNNLDLSENQYLKLDNDANVNLNGGNLNIALDSNSNPLTINIGENVASNANLSILNLNDCTLKIDSTVEDIIIISESELQSPLTIDTSIKSITFESIKLTKEGNIQLNNNDDSVELKINNVEVGSNVQSQLNKVEIVNSITVSQSANLNFNDVKLQNAALNINLKTYKLADYDKKPILSGNYIETPKSIVLNIYGSSDDQKVDDNTGYLLIEGVFNNCKEWKDKISFGNTSFTNGFCSKSNSLQEKNANDEQNKQEFLFVQKIKETKSKNKLSTGEIVGIVIGCVAAVAIIVVVVILVIRKKKAEAISDSP